MQCRIAVADQTDPVTAAGRRSCFSHRQPLAASIGCGHDCSEAIRVRWLFLILVLSGPALAGPSGQVMRVYNNRMEEMFIRLDVNRDGRLDAGELDGHRALGVG